MLSRFEAQAKVLLNDTLVSSLIIRYKSRYIRYLLQKTTVPCVDDIEFNPENSRRATKRPPSPGSTFNPRLSSESPSSSEPTSSWAVKGSSCSESTIYFPARESFSDPGGALLYQRNVLV